MYRQTSLSQTKWDYLQFTRYPSIQDIEDKLLNKWLGLKNHFDITIVFAISVFDISKFNCIRTSVILQSFIN